MLFRLVDGRLRACDKDEAIRFVVDEVTFVNHKARIKDQQSVPRDYVMLESVRSGEIWCVRCDT